MRNSIFHFCPGTTFGAPLEPTFERLRHRHGEPIETPKSKKTEPKKKNNKAKQDQTTTRKKNKKNGGKIEWGNNI